ncbi:MAG: PSD1 and planctomycete cytochrome C domain-containing protein [Planctomycetota bacterium]
MPRLSFPNDVCCHISWFTMGIALCMTLCGSTRHLSAQEPAQTAETIDFQRDIRPILSDTCYKCHGPDANDRQADLRLDTQEGLLESGAVEPNDLDASLLYERILSDDESELMPPPDSGRTLTEDQKLKIKQWIEQGAQWQNHWSLISPRKPSLPQVNQQDWPANAIDNFLLAKLESNRLKPNATADRQTLIRRVAFDVTGLPPSAALVEKYLNLDDPAWYESLVDELFATPAYGEHMARFWLDAARYGDTHGLHLDNYREMWPYRDWVINAFNRNLSFRDFAIEQLAGDLLENPTQDQLIASGFNRAHVTTNEGGSIVEEVYVRNVVDRVSTTGTVFMGLTVGCAQCHDHKFDPISQQEFYQLFAYFNNMSDPPMDKNIKNPQPVIQVMDDDLKKQQAALTKTYEETKLQLDQAIDDFEYVDATPASDPNEVESKAAGTTPDTKGPTEVAAEKRQEFTWVDGTNYPLGASPSGKYKRISDKPFSKEPHTESRQQSGNGTIQHLFTGAIIPLTASAGDTLFADVFLDPKNPPEQVMLQFNNGNWEHRVYWGGDKINWGTNQSPSRFRAGDLPETGKWVRLTVNAESVGFKKSSQINGMAFTQFGGKAYWDTAGIVSQHPQSSGFTSLAKWIAFARKTNHASVPADLRRILKKTDDELTKNQQQKLRRHFLLNIYVDSSKAFKSPVAARDAAKKALDDFNKKIPTTLVSKENETMKDAFILNRGEYDQKGDKVERRTPAALPPFDEAWPNDRLGFAKWLTSGKHPLTARVTVNRFWQQIFGHGLVKTSEDFGSQGDHPTHPELLDWLAVDFVEHDWDVRRLMKMMLMTRAYRQSSVVSEAAYQIDPDNRWVSRGPRYRLDAEMLRDQALSVSGLLNPSLGGPSVKPPQPSGLWFAVGYSSSNTARFSADKGPEKVYRRSLYTFWKRTAPPPQMSTFDAPSREECRVRRERTNTPLQALLLMNEPQYVEAARHLALKASQHNKVGLSEQLAFMFERAITRPPTKKELQILVANYNAHRQEFAAGIDAAKQLLTVGDSPSELEGDEAIDLATMTLVANLVMNMDEFINKN